MANMALTPGFKYEATVERTGLTVHITRTDDKKWAVTCGEDLLCLASDRAELEHILGPLAGFEEFEA